MYIVVGLSFCCCLVLGGKRAKHEAGEPYRLGWTMVPELHGDARIQFKSSTWPSQISFHCFVCLKRKRFANQLVNIRMLWHVVDVDSHRADRSPSWIILAFLAETSYCPEKTCSRIHWPLTSSIPRRPVIPGQVFKKLMLKRPPQQF